MVENPILIFFLTRTRTGRHFQQLSQLRAKIHFSVAIWGFPKIGVPQNGWLRRENPIKMDDLGGKSTIFGNPHLFLEALQIVVNQPRNPGRRLPAFFYLEDHPISCNVVNNHGDRCRP